MSTGGQVRWYRSWKETKIGENRVKSPVTGTAHATLGDAFRSTLRNPYSLIVRRVWLWQGAGAGQVAYNNGNGASRIQLVWVSCYWEQNWCFISPNKGNWTLKWVIRTSVNCNWLVARSKVQYSVTEPLWNGNTGHPNLIFTVNHHFRLTSTTLT